MVYTISTSVEFKKRMKRFRKRHPLFAEQVDRKVLEIARNPDHYKPLSGPLAGLRRVHCGNFVLIFSVHENTVEVLRLDHHDVAYLSRGSLEWR